MGPGAGVRHTRRRAGASRQSDRPLVSTDADADVSRFAEPKGIRAVRSDSPAWRVHADAAMFIGGVRALLLPSRASAGDAGVAQHSDYKRNPLRRLQTRDVHPRTTFGNTRTSMPRDRVRRSHARARIAPDGGLLADDRSCCVGCTRGDRLVLAAYHATAPPADRRGTRSLRRRNGRGGAAIGADWVPRSAAELQAYLADVRSQLVVGEQARETAQWVAQHPAQPGAWARRCPQRCRGRLLLPGCGATRGSTPCPSSIDRGARSLVVRPAATAM